MSTTTLVTAEQLLYMPNDGFRYELIAGEVKKMSPAGWKHGLIAGRLHGWLGRHVEDHGLGALFEGDTGFLLASDPDTVRAPTSPSFAVNGFPPKRRPKLFGPVLPIWRWRSSRRAIRYTRLTRK